MEFAALILTMFLYYLRPQEFLPMVQKIMPVTIAMALAVVGVIFKTRLSLREILKTPHDWLMVLYCCWMIYTTPDHRWAFQQVYPLFLFYLVVVHSVVNLKRMRFFLLTWTTMIFVIAGLALLSQYGFDPTGAHDKTMRFGGRLSMGTSIFANPNALGHSVVPCVLMVYFMFLWRRPIFTRIGGLPLFIIPLSCIYQTMSKGAFISAFAAAVAALSFGRPKYVQLLIVGLALTSGWGAMKMLPRMHEIQSSKDDEAIQGRVEAFKFGIQAYRSGFEGFGFKSFIPRMMESTGLFKASHSSYVQVGAELGKTGLWLFMAIIYVSLRTLSVSKSRNDQEERSRRILFTIIVSYLISSWMVDFAYHASFFFSAGAVAAYHRLLMEKPEAEMEEGAIADPAFAPIPSMQISGLGPVPAGAGIGETGAINQATVATPIGSIPSHDYGDEEKEEPAPAHGQPLWFNKLRLIDIAIIFAMQWGCEWLWVYAIRTM